MINHKNVKTFLVAFNVLGIFLIGCAKERSKEERQREEEEREIQRLSTVEGNYGGLLLYDNDHGTPFDLSVVIRRNPRSGENTPMLESIINVGMFGGVTLSTTTTSFDWGSGRFVASYSGNQKGAGSKISNFMGVAENAEDAPGAKPGTNPKFELRGVLRDGEIADAEVVGPNIGRRALKIKRGAESYLTEETVFQYRLRPNEPGKPDLGVLVLKRMEQQVEPPSSSDLPALPPLLGSIEFFDQAAVSQPLPLVQYDPLTGNMDIVVHGNSTITFRGLQLPTTDGGLGLNTEDKPSATGQIFIGGKPLRELKLVPSAQQLTSDTIGLTPPRYFSGVYKIPAGLEYRTYVAIDDLNTVGTNKPDMPFLLFPNMRLRMVRCVSRTNSGGNSQKVYSLLSMDQLNGLATFKLSGNVGDKYDMLLLRFGERWQTLQGESISTKLPGEGTSSESPTLELTKWDKPQAPTCESIF